MHACTMHVTKPYKRSGIAPSTEVLAHNARSLNKHEVHSRTGEKKNEVVTVAHALNESAEELHGG